VLGFQFTVVGPESNSRLPFNRFNFDDESLVVIRKEPDRKFEVKSRKFEVDFTLRNSNFILLSSRHHTSPALTASSNPTLEIANKYYTRKLVIRLIQVGGGQSGPPPCAVDRGVC